MRIVDTRGQKCPAPILATKKALKEAITGESFEVLTDNQASFDNLRRFLKDNKTQFSVEESDGIWTLTISKGSDEITLTKPAEYCVTDLPHFSQGNFVIALSSDRMGSGDKELGDMLMINFIKAIKDLDILPGKIVFYNRGVMLGKDDSPVIGHLKEIEEMGVKLLICATCIKFYSIEEKIHIGILSNMYEIAQTMVSASNVVKP
jgi:selenium metabolism protein YedF